MQSKPKSRELDDLRAKIALPKGHMCIACETLSASPTLPKGQTVAADNLLPARLALPKGQDTLAGKPLEAATEATPFVPKGQRPLASLAAIQSLEQLRRQYAIMTRANVALTNQIKAICRRASIPYKDILKNPIIYAACLPLLNAQKPIKDALRITGKTMLQLAKELPIATFAQDIKGFGLGGLSDVIGEAGDLSRFATHSKLWAWFGLAPDQKRIKGQRAGYSIQRRSTMWVIGDNLFRARAGNRYQSVYRERRAYEDARGIAKNIAHKRAHRYMEKRLLRDLWKAWQGINQTTENNNGGWIT